MLASRRHFPAREPALAFAWRKPSGSARTLYVLDRPPGLHPADVEVLLACPTVVDAGSAQYRFAVEHNLTSCAVDWV
jgi:excinuclease UvrABC ATPase subunit